MAHFWIHGDDGWNPLSIEDGVWRFDGHKFDRTFNRRQKHNARAAVVASFEHQGHIRHILCTPEEGAAVRVNGLKPIGGARLLRDRDEVLLGDAVRAYYSVERRACVEPFPGIPGRKTICPRCKVPIDEGSPAVRCPGANCGLWYHETETRRCWTYAESCGPCGHPTAFDAEFQWTPAEL